MPHRFLLQFSPKDGDWVDEAICTRDQFTRRRDGSYLCSAFSSGLWLRCVAGDSDGFDHVDGGGDRFRYRLLELPEVS